MPKITSFDGETVSMTLSKSEFNFIRRGIDGYCINTPQNALATYSGYIESEIMVFLDEMYEEAQKFDIEL